ncbi:MAG: anti-sigma factor [Desulfobacteraceae bacterium 4572_35.1]|nr:MAG: anti-sigma factor [Desulfobacteraceae bacterium 4572_35.1]
MKNQLEMDIKVPNQTRYLGLIGKIGEDIAYTLKNYNNDRDELAYHINLVLTEAMANTIKHANSNDPCKDVHITINVSDENLCIKVYDQGQGFDISTTGTALPEPTDDHGRGIFLINTLMDSVTYKNCGNGNVLEMKKRLN